jgi:hypothetical protein
MKSGILLSKQARTQGFSSDPDQVCNAKAENLLPIVQVFGVWQGCTLGLRYKMPQATKLALPGNHVLSLFFTGSRLRPDT